MAGDTTPAIIKKYAFGSHMDGPGDRGMKWLDGICQLSGHEFEQTLEMGKDKPGVLRSLLGLQRSTEQQL